MGDIPAAAALRAKVEPAVHPSVQGSATAGGPAASGSAPSGSAASGSAGGSAGPQAPTEAQTHAQSRAVPLAKPATAVRCEAAARALQPSGPQSLIYAAAARWQGTPADVLAFAGSAPATTTPGRNAPVRVYVMAARGCRLLVFQSYAP